MKLTKSRALAIALCASALAVSVVDCMAQSPNSASFSSFKYNGNDDYYKSHQLPDETYFYNPVFPGWYSDPSICTNGEGDYFLVTSTFTYFPGVPIFHSRDLVNWKQIGNVLSRESQCVNFKGQNVSGGIFAPAISYNPANKTYYMITTNVGAGNFFVKTTDPFGEWSDPIYVPEVQGIDPAFFFDNDGKAYIVNNDDALKPEYPGHRTVRVVEFDPATDKCVGERRIVVDKGVRPSEKPIWCEGPHIYNINGTYYLMTAEGGTGDWHSEVIYKGNSPFGPFIPWDKNPMLTQRTLDRNRDLPITCAGHADLVQEPNGQWWGVFLACRPLANGVENLGRETFLLPVQWTSDGWPYMNCEDEAIPLMLRKYDVKRTQDYPGGNFAYSMDLSSGKLGNEWMTLRGAATDLYEINPATNTIKLACAPVSSAERLVPAFVARRIQHHKFDASTVVEFNAANDNERAGLLVFKDETHQYFLAKGKNKGKNCVSLIKVTPEGEQVVASIPMSSSKVGLKVVSNGPTFNFYASPNGGNGWKLVAKDVDAAFTSTANAGGFTGTTIGMYATSAQK